MTIRKPLVSECFECVKGPTNNVDKNDVAVVLLVTVKKRWLVMCNRYP